MKAILLPLSSLTLMLCWSSSYAETLQQVCELPSDIAQCPSVKHFVNQPFEAKDDFEKYKLCSEAKYDLYKIEKNCEFDQYVVKAQKAFDEYKSKVSKKWDAPNFSDKHSWVSYSPSLELKREVNFEKNIIKVTTIAGESTTVEQLKEEIVATSQLTVGEAQSADVYTSALMEVTNAKPSSKQSLVPLSEDKQIEKQELDEALESITIKESVDSLGNKVIEAEVSFPPAWLDRKEKRFFNTVKRYSSKYDIEPEFILSIIKTESAFDPTAVSHIPAFGLMQIVPSSAGLDATGFLFGESQLLNKDYLFDPEKNIEVGTAYIHLLRSRYFNGVENEDSLKYCVIAAYNGGMGPIYRIFGGKRSVAIDNINRLSSQEVYRTIHKKHSAAETRKYLEKVHNAELNYENKTI